MHGYTQDILHVKISKLASYIHRLLCGNYLKQGQGREPGPYYTVVVDWILCIPQALVHICTVVDPGEGHMPGLAYNTFLGLKKNLSHFDSPLLYMSAAFPDPGNLIFQCALTTKNWINSAS